MPLTMTSEAAASSSSSSSCGTMKQLVRKAASDDVDARMPMRAGTCHAASYPPLNKQRAASGGAGSHDVAWHHRHYASLQHNVGGRHKSANEGLDCQWTALRTTDAVRLTLKPPRRSTIDVATTAQVPATPCYAPTRVTLPNRLQRQVSVAHPPISQRRWPPREHRP